LPPRLARGQAAAAGGAEDPGAAGRTGAAAHEPERDGAGGGGDGGQVLLAGHGRRASGRAAVGQPGDGQRPRPAVGGVEPPAVVPVGVGPAGHGMVAAQAEELVIVVGWVERSEAHHLRVTYGGRTTCPNGSPT